MKPRRSLRIGCALISLLLPLLVAEVYLRATGYNPYQRLLDGKELLIRESPAPHVLYELVPNASGTVWSTQVRINSMGLRDREYTEKKPPGVYRILTLGDSITFGNYVGAPDAYPEQLERMLEAQPGRFEVLNLGLGGYDTLNEVALLEHKGIDLSPDLVIVGFCINDAGTVSVNLGAALRTSDWGVLYQSRVYQFLQKRLEASALSQEIERVPDEAAFRRANAGNLEPIGPEPELRQMQRRLDATLKSRYEPDDPHRKFLGWYTSEARLGKLRFAFQWLQRLQQAHRFEVLIAFFPGVDVAEHREAYEQTRDIVQSEAQRLGFGFTDLIEPFASGNTEQLAAGRRDFVHPNAEGHRRIAQELLRQIAALRAKSLAGR